MSATTRTLADVDPAVRVLLADLRTVLEALYGDRLVRLVLFGSHARGDAHAESDVDVLVVLRGEVHVYREVRRMGSVVSEVGVEHAFAIAAIPISADAPATNMQRLLYTIEPDRIAA